MASFKKMMNSKTKNDINDLLQQWQMHYMIQIICEIALNVEKLKFGIIKSTSVRTDVKI